MTTPGVPRLARSIASFAAPPDDRDLILADLRERFDVICAERGRVRARIWYWSQALRGLGAAVLPSGALAQRLTQVGLAADVRHAMRGMRRRPLFALGVVGTLGLGLASAAAVLSVTWHVWLAPMPYPQPDGVVRLFELKPADDAAPSVERERWRLSPPLVEDLRKREWTTVRQVAGVSSNVLDWTRDAEVTRLQATVVSPEAFDILGIAPRLGRGLSMDEERPEVVLTSAFWERAFGGDPTVVSGTRMTFGGVDHEIVGVADLPAGYPRRGDVIVRMAFEPDQLVTGMRGARYLDVIARVDPAFRPADVAEELTFVVESLAGAHPNHAGWAGDAVILGDDLLRPYRQVLALLLTAGGLFMLLAVVNVAGLIGARIVDAREDRAVRLALGASHGRLLRGQLVESLVLGVLAAAVALMAATALMGPIRALVPAEIPRVENVGLGPEVIVTIGVLAVLCGLVVGILGHRLSRSAPPALGRSARSTTPRTAGRELLVVGQVALTVLLATAGAGILRHVASLRATDLGFEPVGVASTQVMLTGGRYPSPGARLAFWRDLIADFDARGVDAAIGTSPPMAGANMPWGYRPDPTAEQEFAQYHIVSPAYFRLFSIDVLEGRAFTSDDRADAAPVIIVNEALARMHFGEESAVGRTITVLDREKEIVGVVRSVRHTGPLDDAPPEIYAPFEQDPWPHAQIVVRGEPGALGATVAEVANRLDPALGLAPLAPYERFVAEWFAALRLQSIIVGVLAVVGTMLATLGLYALVAYRVTSRRREIGVRMALGASGSRMFADVVRRGAFLSGAGVVVGLAVWYLSLPFTADLLGEIDERHPLAPLAAGSLVMIVSFIASAFPAGRTVIVDPATTLRSE